MTSFTSRSHGYKLTAFTLVELLVVIGIIALLISMLLPSLNRARESARNAQCMSNLRQIGMAISLYRNAHQDYLPARFAPWDSARWQWAVAAQLGLEFDPNNPDKQPSIFRCVTQGDYWPDVPYSGNYRVSYAINFLGSDGDWDHWGRYHWLRGKRVNNSTFHYIADINPTWYPWHYSFGGEDVTWQLAFRHGGKRANFLYLDGHVAGMDRSEYQSKRGVYGSQENKERLGF